MSRTWSGIAGGLFLLGAATLARAAEEKPAPVFGDGRGVAPSFLFSSPHQALEETALPLEAIDFRNRAYRLSGGVDGEAPAEFRLHDGRYAGPGKDSPAETVEISDLRFLPSGAAPPRMAVVFLTRVRTGAGSECVGMVQFFTVSGRHVVLQHQVRYNCHGESGARLGEPEEDLEIRSVAYAQGDARCCPSFQDLARFKIDPEELKLSGWERRPYPKGEP